MKFTSTFLFGILWMLSFSHVAAQAPRPPQVPTSQNLSYTVGRPHQQPTEPELLSKNYRITFSGTSGDKSLGELTNLTCAPRIQVSGPLNSTETPTTFQVEGTLTEKEDSLTFTYSISFAAPTPTQAPGAIPAGIPQSGVRPNVNYASHTTSGTLRMVAGEKYEILKCGGNIYTITIEPESKK